jgi:ABC-type transporter Mla subunit MlaD
MSSPALFVTTGSNDARRLKAGEVMRSQEAVGQDEIALRIATLAATANDLLLDVKRELPSLATEAHAVLANLNQITGPRNQKQIDGALAELNTILQRESPKIAQITERVAAVIGSAGPLLSNLDTTVTNANVTIDAIREPLTKDLAEMEKVLQDARTLLGSVQDLVHSNDGDVAETVRALHATAENLRAFSETLKQRPWNLIRTAQPADRRVPR